MERLLNDCYSKFGVVIDTPTDIKFYELDNISLDRIVEYSQALNYDIKEFSYENKPDFSKYSYREGLVWVYNPNDNKGSFDSVEYTRKWRYIHELAHAITYNYILAKYNISKVNRGSGRLNYNDAVIALDWEIETMKLQYTILSVLGVEVGELYQNREINTLFADLTYRCLSGEFTNPDLNGFLPSNEALGDWKETLKDLYINNGGLN